MFVMGLAFIQPEHGSASNFSGKIDEARFEKIALALLFLAGAVLIL